VVCCCFFIVNCARHMKPQSISNFSGFSILIVVHVHFVAAQLDVSLIVIV